ncbi:hypothetical protein BJV78DRAFT_271734 [Lactifluus subvellereus]|nr:hypothetical protein BJV78DRAFT_271734 [Lactifluus subvellereus]
MRDRDSLRDTLYGIGHAPTLSPRSCSRGLSGDTLKTQLSKRKPSQVAALPHQRPPSKVPRGSAIGGALGMDTGEGTGEKKKGGRKKSFRVFRRKWTRVFEFSMPMPRRLKGPRPRRLEHGSRGNLAASSCRLRGPDRGTGNVHRASATVSDGSFCSPSFFFSFLSKMFLAQNLKITQGEARLP